MRQYEIKEDELEDDEWDWRWERDDMEEEEAMASRLRRMVRANPDTRPEIPPLLVFLRRLMTLIEAPSVCGRPQCRRARACLSPRVECAWRKIPYLQRDIFWRLGRLCGANPAPSVPFELLARDAETALQRASPRPGWRARVVERERLHDIARRIMAGQTG
ncbi:MAG: hypothetical protein U1E28_19720 [Beijerinckiaceae bacterium]